MESLSQIPGIGPKTIAKLNKLDIFTPLDLLHHYPYRYVDFSHITKISSASENTAVTITGKLISFQNIFTKYHKNFQKAVVADDTGQINLLWFNQPYLAKNFRVGETYSFAGTVPFFKTKKPLLPQFPVNITLAKLLVFIPKPVV